MKILIIDDETDFTASIAARFKTLDEAEVEVANDPLQGLEAAKRRRPDAILMDVYMPQMDGWEATRRLRQTPETKDVPVVIMTAVLSKALMEQVRAVGAQRVITKPFEERDLISLLAWLGTRPTVAAAVPPVH